MAVAEEYGCEVPFQCPDELAQDDTPSIDALLHALDQIESHDYVVMLQSTSRFALPSTMTPALPVVTKVRVPSA